MAKEQTTLHGLRLRETRAEGGFAEIVVYERDKRDSPIAVISRQITGGKWCVYPYGAVYSMKREKTRRGAIAYAAGIWASGGVA